MRNGLIQLFRTLNHSVSCTYIIACSSRFRYVWRGFSQYWAKLCFAYAILVFVVLSRWRKLLMSAWKDFCSTNSGLSFIILPNSQDQWLADRFSFFIPKCLKWFGTEPLLWMKVLSSTSSYIIPKTMKLLLPLGAMDSRLLFRKSFYMAFLRLPVSKRSSNYTIIFSNDIFVRFVYNQASV